MNRLITLFAVLASLGFASCANNNDYPGGSGLIEADQTLISAEVAGKILIRNFDEGSYLTRGDTLVVIDHDQIDLQIKSAEAGLAALRSKLSSARIQVTTAQSSEKFTATERDRANRLVSTSSGSEHQLDQAQFNYDQAKLAVSAAKANVETLRAEISRAEAELSQLRLRQEDHYPVAPVSGVVSEKYISPGELIAPGKPLAEISQLDTVWVKVYLPAGKFAGVKTGDSARVDTESGETHYTGTVVWTSSEAEFTPKNVQTEQSRADLVYAVKVSIPNTDGKLKIGMPVFVTLED